MTQNRRELVARETRLAALSVHGNVSPTITPIIAVYLKTTDEHLNAYLEEGQPIFTIHDLASSSKYTKTNPVVELFFDVPELGNPDNKIPYTLKVDSQYVLAAFPLHLIGGETYFALFNAETSVHSKRTKIQVDDLQVLLKFPGQDVEEFRTVAEKVSELAPAGASDIAQSILKEETEELSIIREERGKLLVLLAELASGSEKAFIELLSLINPLNSFEDNVIINQHEPTDEDKRMEVLIGLVDRILFKTNTRNIPPKRMNAEEIHTYHKEYDAFNEIMEDMDDQFASLLNELSVNDRKFLEAEDMKERNADALNAYLIAPITMGTLPQPMRHLAAKIDFNNFFDTDWSKISSVSSFLDENGEQPNTFGENVVSAIIAATIRIARLSEINGVPPSLFLTSVLGESTGTEDTHWELLAFTERLAQGDTQSFKEMLNVYPRNGMPLSAFLGVSHVGFIGLALARSILEEQWSQDVLHLAFKDNEIATTFVDSVFSNIGAITEQVKEQFADQKLDEDNMRLLQTQIRLQSIQLALSQLGERYDSPDIITTGMVDAMLTIADLNTGKQTVSTENSPEWVSVKKAYLINFLSLNTGHGNNDQDEEE